MCVFIEAVEQYVLCSMLIGNSSTSWSTVSVDVTGCCIYTIKSLVLLSLPDFSNLDYKMLVGPLCVHHSLSPECLRKFLKHYLYVYIYILYIGPSTTSTYKQSHTCSIKVHVHASSAEQCFHLLEGLITTVNSI